MEKSLTWTSKDFDPQVLSSALLKVMQQTLEKAGNIPQSQEPTTETVAIEDYGGRMRISGIEQFNNLCYVSVINFYTSQADLEKHKAKGALIIYMESENAAKFFKALGIAFLEDEDDASMTVGCGKFAQMIVDGFKAELSAQGYAELILSKPLNYKNKVFEGVDFFPGQKAKHHIGFYYFKHKVIAADLTLAPIPKK